MFRALPLPRAIALNSSPNAGCFLRSCGTPILASCHILNRLGYIHVGYRLFGSSNIIILNHLVHYRITIYFVSLDTRGFEGIVRSTKLQQGSKI